tara:strand:+ start:589 stop:1269 length:681 start_codon:yes stop_codon:yes gene_type:complete
MDSDYLPDAPYSGKPVSPKAVKKIVKRISRSRTRSVPGPARIFQDALSATKRVKKRGRSKSPFPKTLTHKSKDRLHLTELKKVARTVETLKQSLIETVKKLPIATALTDDEILGRFTVEHCGNLLTDFKRKHPERHSVFTVSTECEIYEDLLYISEAYVKSIVELKDKGVAISSDVAFQQKEKRMKLEEDIADDERLLNECKTVIEFHKVVKKDKSFSSTLMGFFV